MGTLLMSIVAVRRSETIEGGSDIVCLTGVCKPGDCVSAQWQMMSDEATPRQARGELRLTQSAVVLQEWALGIYVSSLRDRTVPAAMQTEQTECAVTV
jgi:hypothetical protein